MGVGSVGWGSASSGWKFVIKFTEVTMPECISAHFVMYLCLAEAKVAQEQEVVKGNVANSRIASHCRDNQLNYWSILIFDVSNVTLNPSLAPNST